MDKRAGLNSRLLMMITYTGVVFVLLFTTLIILQRRQARMIHKEAEEQFSREVNSIIGLKSGSQRQIAFDYTYWDEFASVMVSGARPEWFDENIATITSSYGYDYVAVFDTNYRIVFEHWEKPTNNQKVISAEILDSLKYKKILNFFIHTDSGVIEVSSASIHPTFDRDRKITTPKGYLFIGKIWTGDFIGTLSAATGSQIKLGDEREIREKSEMFSILYNYKFLDWKGVEIGNIWFEREALVFKLYSESSVYMLIILLLSTLFIWFTNRYSVKHWVLKPLTLVERILKNESTADISSLKRAPGEFSQIAVLFEKYIKQKEELKEAKDRAERADKLKTQFLANMSHEIRTPMNGIIGFSELLKDVNIEHSQRMEYLTIIQNSGERMMSLINDLINISKLESGQEDVSESTVSLKNVCENVYSFFKPEAQKKGLNIIFTNSAEEKDTLVSTDREKLYGIINNLVKNAVKYSKEGSIEFGYTVKEDYSIQFFVKDEGIGISSDIQSRIFDRFVQGEATLNKNYEGVGLGLAIAKAYVTILGGDIWVESEQGKGSIFFFTLPYKY